MEKFIIGRAINGRAFLINEEDDDLLKFPWNAAVRGKNIYLMCSSKGLYKNELLHRVIMKRIQEIKIGYEVDHENHCGLDNRRANLRLATRQQNNANQNKTHGTSRFKGVYRDIDRAQWAAQIKINGTRKFLGRFDDEEDAARTYDAAAIDAFGEFAKTNESP